MIQSSFKDGNLQIGLTDLVEHLSDECAVALADSLSCHKPVIENVVNLLLEGSTELASWPARGFGGEALSAGRELIAERYHDAALEEIRQLKSELESAQRMSRYHQQRWEHALKLIRTFDDGHQMVLSLLDKEVTV